MRVLREPARSCMDSYFRNSTLIVPLRSWFALWLQRTHPDAEADLRASLRQRLRDGPAEALQRRADLPTHTCEPPVADPAAHERAA